MKRNLVATAGLVVLAMAPGVYGQSTVAAFPGVTTYEILPGSSFDYLLPGLGPAPDCDLNDDLACSFAVSGTFTLQTNFAGAGTITDANLTLVAEGPETPTFPLTTADGVEAWLMDLDLFLLDTTVAPTFKDTRFPEFTLTLMGNQSRLLGGFDDRPVDGDGLIFSVDAVAIPEPTATALLACLAPLAGLRRRSWGSTTP